MANTTTASTITAESIRTDNQTRNYGPKLYKEDGSAVDEADMFQVYRIKATVRHDDRCNNGHNTFSITGEISRTVGDGHRERTHWQHDSSGCIHDEIAQHFPELAHLIKWHLCSTDGPLHYVENTRYWLGWSREAVSKKWVQTPPNFDFARKSAVWPEATDEELGKMQPDEIEWKLKARLPALLAAFRADVEAMGLTW